MRLRSDRGTVVIDEVESGVNPQSLVEVTWDQELSAWRTPASSHALVRGRLSDGGVRVADDVEAPVRVDGVRVPGAALVSARGDRGVARGRRTRCGRAADRHRQDARRDRRDRALGVATLVLVPTRVLLDQWARAIAASWPHPIGRLGDGDHTITPITIATYASAIAWAPRIGDRFGLVVVDEAHHVGAWCPAEVLEMLVAPARLGLTATPPGAGRSPDHVGPVVYALSIAELVGDGLAAHDLVQVPIDLTATSAPATTASAARSRPPTPRSSAGSRARAGSSSSRVLAQRDRTRRAGGVARIARGARVSGRQARRARKLLATHAGERTLVFTGDNATAYAIARELLVMPITHEIGRAERAAMLERFRPGEVPVLVSSQVLDEGLDVPEAEIAIVVGGTASARRHVQRIGRVLRPRRGKRARIYELAVQATVEVEQVTSRRAGVAS